MKTISVPWKISVLLYLYYIQGLKTLPGLLLVVFINLSQRKETFPSHDTGTRYPLGLTVISYLLMKTKDAIKEKDPMYCRIWFPFPGSTLYILTFFKGISKLDVVKS